MGSLDSKCGWRTPFGFVVLIGTRGAAEIVLQSSTTMEQIKASCSMATIQAHLERIARELPANKLVVMETADGHEVWL